MDTCRLLRRSRRNGMTSPFERLLMRAGICFALMCCATSLVAQQPDSAQADSAKLLPEITVTVTRTPEALSKIPAAVSVVPMEAVRRGQATLGLDESLS